MTIDSAIFLDRDNTLTVDEGYTSDPNKFAWVKGAPDALKLFNDLSLPVFVFTNQGGIGRGFFTEQDMQNFNNKLIHETRKIGGDILDIAFCPHHPLSNNRMYNTPCLCRKPKPGMLLNLAEKWKINLSKSLVIGDSDSDIKAGNSAGCSSVLLKKRASLFITAKSALIHYGIRTCSQIEKSL